MNREPDEVICAKCYCEIDDDPDYTRMLDDPDAVCSVCEPEYAEAE